MRKNINRHRRPRVVVVTFGPPLLLSSIAKGQGQGKVSAVAALECEMAAVAQADAPVC